MADKADVFFVDAYVEPQIVLTEGQYHICAKLQDIATILEDGSEYLIQDGNGALIEIPKIIYSFAIYSDDDNSLTFYSDSDIPSAGSLYDGKTATNIYTDFDTETWVATSDVAWYGIRESIKTVAIDKSYKAIKPVSLALWFYEMSNATFTGLENIDASNVKTMHQMFRGCSTMESIEIPFDTSNIETFSQCFYGCSNAKEANLSNVNVDSAATFANMFNGCSSLETADLSGWNTWNVTSMNAMFYNCTNLQTIYEDRDFDLSSNPTGTNMFYNCQSLVGGNGTKWDSSNITQTMAHIDREDNPGYFTEK